MLFRRRNQNSEQVYKEAFRSFFQICMRYWKSRSLAEEVFNDGMVKYFKYERNNRIDPKTKFALIKKIIRSF